MGAWRKTLREIYSFLIFQIPKFGRIMSQLTVDKSNVTVSVEKPGKQTTV